MTVGRMNWSQRVTWSSPRRLHIA